MQTSKENNFILVRTEFLYLNTNPLGLRNQLCQELFREQWSPFHTTTLISCNLSYKARASEHLIYFPSSSNPSRKPYGQMFISRGRPHAILTTLM